MKKKKSVAAFVLGLIGGILGLIGAVLPLFTSIAVGVITGGAINYTAVVICLFLLPAIITIVAAALCFKRATVGGIMFAVTSVATILGLILYGFAIIPILALIMYFIAMILAFVAKPIAQTEQAQPQNNSSQVSENADRTYNLSNEDIGNETASEQNSVIPTAQYNPIAAPAKYGRSLYVSGIFLLLAFIAVLILHFFGYSYNFYMNHKALTIFMSVIQMLLALIAIIASVYGLVKHKNSIYFVFLILGCIALVNSSAIFLIMSVIRG